MMSSLILSRSSPRKVGCKPSNLPGCTGLGGSLLALCKLNLVFRQNQAYRVTSIGLKSQKSRLQNMETLLVYRTEGEAFGPFVN